MKKVALLGSTGSIGTQALEFIRSYPDDFEIVSLAAGNNLELLKDQIAEFKPQYVSVISEDAAAKLKEIHSSVDINHGQQGLIEAVDQDVDLVLMAVSGITALLPTLKAIDLGKDIAIANKELLVAAGDLVIKKAQKNDISLIPVDSEHSAIMQLIYHNDIKGFIDYRTSDIKQIILTASGGAFRDDPADSLVTKTPADALKHPTWSMGKKITIDSATMMNKGLEVIEAQKLFGIDISRINVLIHPQSLVHGMVEFNDGSMLAQMGPNDMKLPIGFALSYGQRRNSSTEFNMINAIIEKGLQFSIPDEKKYPALQLAYQVAKNKGTYPAVLNAANEVAVSLFLEKKIKFTQIVEYVDRALQAHQSIMQPDIDQIIAEDQKTRQLVLEIQQKDK